jgi:protein TIF31
VLSDFGDAALRGVKAILDGYIQPMNPNEPLRSHVYLHNNIFFSRALETGLDTFKVIQGDAAAKKSASRDANNMGVLHRLDIPGLHTLATVLVEYLGTRIVCQSVVPGILHGEKSHSILYGAVETLSELKCNEEMHKLLENSIGEDCMVATRTIPVYPFTDERMDDIKKTRALALPESEKTETNNADNNANGKDKSVQVCGPLEMKGILGSDQRKYVLDCTRLTPRDANWVCEESGGTGCWEDAHRNGAKSHKFVPSTLDDVEWTVCVLRQELVTHYAEMKICDFVKEKEGKVNLKDGQIEVEDKKEEPQIENEHSSTVNINEPSKDTDKEKEWVEVKKEGKGEVSHELMNKKSMSSPFAKLEEEFILSLRYNVNVFLPFTRSFETIDTNLQQLKKDEEEAREMARYLWNTVIPNFTKEIRSSSGNGLQMPSDGQSLTDVIHQRGINW